MEKNSGKDGSSRRLSVDAASESRPADAFPETKTNILQDAADGEWQEFFNNYLQPCWREIVIRCRVNRIPLENADDLFQELTLRLLKKGRLGKYVRDLMRPTGDDTEFRGNAPARYLMFKACPAESPRFRTYLKGIIRNLILESLGNRSRQTQSLEVACNVMEPRIDESITRSLDRQWTIECLDMAAIRLLSDSTLAATKGKRRMFDVLYMELAEGISQVEIARRLQLDPSTVSQLKQIARVRFIRILQEVTGVADLGELREIVAGSTEALRAAFRRARQNDRLEKPSRSCE